MALTSSFSLSDVGSRGVRSGPATASSTPIELAVVVRLLGRLVGPWGLRLPCQFLATTGIVSLRLAVAVACSGLSVVGSSTATTPSFELRAIALEVVGRSAVVTRILVRIWYVGSLAVLVHHLKERVGKGLDVRTLGWDCVGGWLGCASR